MRGALVHVFTGLALGVALVGLLHAPTELIAQQEARTAVVQPKAATAGLWTEEQTVRVSPKVERELELERARRLRPEVARPAEPRTAPARPILVRATEPITPVAPPAPQPDHTAAKPKPTGAPKSTPPPVYTPAAEDEDKKAKKHKKPKKDKADEKDEDERSGDDDDDDEDDDGDDEQDERDKPEDQEDDDREDDDDD